LLPTGLAVTIAVPISTSGNSALLITAGYMIINELALNLAGSGVKPHPAEPADLIHRVLAAPTRAEGSSSRRDSSTSRTVYGVLCEGDTADGGEGINSDTSGLHGQHKIISDGQDHRGGSGQDKNSWLLTPRHRQRV
jgi:hypothetical protein